MRRWVCAVPVRGIQCHEISLSVASCGVAGLGLATVQAAFFLGATVRVLARRVGTLR